ncbi:MAG: hypothetical protein DI566_13440 [Microbacterium sp.]|nr:MAG: hypothetical protein DI566_13440 [Microbacterium sp.]
MSDGPPIPAHLQPYVDAMGRQLAVRFFLRFGGAPLYIPENPSSKSALAELIGERAVRRLFEIFDAREARPARIPVDKKWLARQMRHDGEAVLEIARTLHVSDVMVRRYLADKTRDRAQLALNL